MLVGAHVKAELADAKRSNMTVKQNNALPVPLPSLPFSLKLLTVIAMVLACLVFSGGGAVASYLDVADSPFVKTQIQLAIDNIYNFEFTEANSIIEALKTGLKDHPVLPLLRFFLLYWESGSVVDGSTAYLLLLKQSGFVLAKSDALAKNPERRRQADFFRLIIHAYLTDLHFDNGNTLEAFRSALRCFEILKYRLDPTDDDPEDYFMAGLYHYYRVRKPAESKMLKPLASFFPPGDLGSALEYLERGSRSAVFTRNECFRYRFHFFLRYEGRPEQSLESIRYLRDKYPKNPLYAAFYAENLYRLARYEEMRKSITVLIEQPNAYYGIMGDIFQGLYLEHYQRDFSGAKNRFQAAEKRAREYQGYPPHFLSYLYAGLGRLAATERQQKAANRYFSLAEEHAEYASVNRLVREDRERYRSSGLLSPAHAENPPGL
jgi:hypothetical protein